MNKNMKKRLRNPIFIIALVGVVYQLCQKYGVNIDENLLKDIVDILSYLFIGVGVYSTFDKEGETNE